jgi:hypothetical protein
MTLKLTYQQAEALFNLFNEMVLLSAAVSLDEKLVMLHMGSIYKKLRNKWEGIAKGSYRLTVTEAEAIAYRIYWRNNDITRFPYEWNMILSHCIQIDREITAHIIQHSKLKFLK